MSNHGSATPDSGAQRPELRNADLPPHSLAGVAASAVHDTLGVPGARSSAAEACTALAARMTHGLGTAFERISQEEPIACRPSCSFCCHLRVMVYPFEAIALAAQVGSHLPATEAAAVKLGLLAAARHLEALEAAEPFPAMACPFLADGRCRVYALRPLPCAGYHSLQRGACQMRYETRGGRVGIPVSRALQDAAVTLYEEAGHALTQLGLAAGRVELVTAVAALLQRPELVDHWLAGGEWPRDARGLVRSA